MIIVHCAYFKYSYVMAMYLLVHVQQSCALEALHNSILSISVHVYIYMNVYMYMSHLLLYMLYVVRRSAHSVITLYTMTSSAIFTVHYSGYSGHSV